MADSIEQMIRRFEHGNKRDPLAIMAEAMSSSGMIRKKFTLKYWIGHWGTGANLGDYGIFDLPIMLLTLPFLYAYYLADVLRYGKLQHFTRPPSWPNCVVRCLILGAIIVWLGNWIAR
jgi:hypothetical protein